MTCSQRGMSSPGFVSTALDLPSWSRVDEADCQLPVAGSVAQAALFEGLTMLTVGGYFVSRADRWRETGC